MSLGPSAPGFVPIHAKRSTEGPSTSSMSVGLDHEAGDETCPGMASLIGHPVHPRGAPAGCEDGGSKLGPPGSRPAGDVYPM
eukprot:4170690-Pyramimonas_sp.AAC.1